MKKDPKQCVVLLSGGLDSTTVLYYALNKGYQCHCLVFDYGQRHTKEIALAKRIAKRSQCRSTLINIQLPWKGSSLIDTKLKLPQGKIKHTIVPSTYVPGRNTIFLSYAMSFAETIHANTLFIGANILDYSGYPDCRPSYIKAWNKLLRTLGTKIQIKAPLIQMTKSEIIKLGLSLRVPYELTWSCYAGQRVPCGKCDSCLLRKKGFIEAGLPDPSL